MLIGASSKPHDIAINTHGSVIKDQSGWGLTTKQVGGLYTKIVVPTVTVSHLTMQIDAVTHALQ